MMLTGLKWDTFQNLFLYLVKFIKTKPDSLPARDQLLITLVKLRHHLSFDLLADIRKIPKSTTIDIFWRWVDLMYAKLSFLIKWQDRDHIFEIIPSIFKAKFPRLTSIIDCFEIFIEAPKGPKARAQYYSTYKKHTTIKVFISCSPLGNTNFISKAWGGRASDVQIVRESGFIAHKYYMPRDQILADRGFTLVDDFAAACGAELINHLLQKAKGNYLLRRSKELVKFHLCVYT